MEDRSAMLAFIERYWISIPSLTINLVLEKCYNTLTNDWIASLICYHPISIPKAQLQMKKCSALTEKSIANVF